MQSQVELLRLEKSEEGVFGMLRINGQVQCVTLEPPEKNNMPNLSCIPAGGYRCRKRNSHRFGETFEVTGVPGRTDILFHAGNLATDSRGCVLLGQALGKLQGRRAILRSRDAVENFRAMLGDDAEFELQVHELYGETGAVALGVQ